MRRAREGGFSSNRSRTGVSLERRRWAMRPPSFFPAVFCLSLFPALYPLSFTAGSCLGSVPGRTHQRVGKHSPLLSPIYPLSSFIHSGLLPWLCAWGRHSEAGRQALTTTTPLSFPLPRLYCGTWLPQGGKKNGSEGSAWTKWITMGVERAVPICMMQLRTARRAHRKTRSFEI